MAVVFVDGDDVEFGVVEGGEGFECGWLPGLLVVVVVEEVGGVHSMGDCSMFRWLGEVKKATPAAVGLPELLFPPGGETSEPSLSVDSRQSLVPVLLFKLTQV